jgi:hypothetical protein
MKTTNGRMLRGVSFLILSWLCIASDEAQAAIRYAKPNALSTGSCLDWTNACTLQQAIAVAVGGDQIWAAKGTYRLTSVGSSFSLKNAVEMYGGFDGPVGGNPGENALYLRDADREPYTVDPNTDSILSGDVNNDDAPGSAPDHSSRFDNAQHVVTVPASPARDLSTVLDGFTVYGGYENGQDPT